MVIPIGDENPRTTTPWVSWCFAALTAFGWLSCALSGHPFGGALSFFLSPVLAPDLVTAIWCVLAYVILADNVEDRLGPVWHLCLLVGTGWAGAAVRSFDAPTGSAILGPAALNLPLAGAGASATAAAVAYVVFFPLQQIAFFHIFGGRRRFGYGGWASLLDLGPGTSGSSGNTFYVTSPFGIFLWGLGMLAGAFVGWRMGGDLAALITGLVAGAGTALAFRLKSGQPLLPVELDTRPPGPESRKTLESIDPGPFFAPKPLEAPPPFAVGGWAVLRETDELYDVGRLGRIAAQYMHVPVADATRRIRQTRGVLARRLDRENALAMAKAVTAAGVPAFAVFEEQTGGLPLAQMTSSCGCNSKGIEVEFEAGRKQNIGWPALAVAAAARVDDHDQAVTVVDSDPSSPSGVSVVARDRITQTTLIDIVTHSPPARFRIARQEATTGDADVSSSAFREFAASLLRNRGAAPVNKGISVIAARGAWGYLAFDSQQAYEEYLWWLLQVIRRRSAPAAPAAATSYLE